MRILKKAFGLFSRPSSRRRFALCPTLEFNRSAYAAIAKGASPHKLFVAIDRVRIGVYGGGFDVADGFTQKGVRHLLHRFEGGWTLYFSEDTREKGLTLVKLDFVGK